MENKLIIILLLAAGLAYANVSVQDSCAAPYDIYQCTDVSECGEGFDSLPGYCPGPANIQCCVPFDGTQDANASGTIFTDTLSLYGSCTEPYEEYSCVDTGSCAGISYPGQCGGGAGIQCCIPRENYRELKHVYDNANVVSDESEITTNEILLRLENENSITIVFVTTRSVPDIRGLVNDIYEQEDMDRSAVRMLFVLDTDTNVMSVRAGCPFYRDQFWNIVMGDGYNNKRLLDTELITGEYIEAFPSIANDIYNYVQENPHNIACSDPGPINTASEFVSASLTGSNWEQQLANACARLPQLLSTNARRINMQADDRFMEDLSRDACLSLLREEITERISFEAEKLQYAIDDSHRETQFVRKTPQCLPESLGNYGCVQLPSGLYDLRNCAVTSPNEAPGSPVYEWVDDSFLGAGFGERAAVYQTFEECRDECIGSEYSFDRCAEQINIPEEIGTDNLLGVLEGKVERSDLESDKKDIENLVSCYTARERDTLNEVLENAQFCPGATVFGAGGIGDLFKKNAQVIALSEVEQIWISDQQTNERTLCDASWNAVQIVEAAGGVREKINAYNLVYENCKHLSDAESLERIQIAENNILALPESGFLRGTWNVVKTFGEPVNLAILGGTMIVTVAAPPIGVAIGGETLATTIATARAVKGFHAAVGAAFAVPMAVHLPGSIAACAEAGISSQRCGEATAQIIMVGALLRTTVRSVNELRLSTAEATAGRLESYSRELAGRYRDEIAILENEKASLFDRSVLDGCATCATYTDRLAVLDEQIRLIRERADRLEGTPRENFLLLARHMQENRMSLASKPDMQVRIIETLDRISNRIGSPEMRQLVGELERNFLISDRFQIKKEVPQQRRGVADPERPGARVAPRSSRTLEIEFDIFDEVRIQNLPTDQTSGAKIVRYNPRSEQGGFIHAAKPEISPFELDILTNRLGMKLSNVESTVILAIDKLTGEHLGYLSYHKIEGGGFVIRKIEVSTSARGQGIASDLLLQAFDNEGPYKGVFPFQMSPEYVEFITRMRNKPEYSPVFEGYRELPSDIVRITSGENAIGDVDLVFEIIE